MPLLQKSFCVPVLESHHIGPLRGHCSYLQTDSFHNPYALRMAKTLWSFGRPECNRVKSSLFKTRSRNFKSEFSLSGCVYSASSILLFDLSHETTSLKMFSKNGLHIPDEQVWRLIWTCVVYICLQTGFLLSGPLSHQQH